MSDRFYLDPSVSTIDGDLATLGGDEAHHFSRVMRGKVGDELVLFDGSGPSYRGKVESVGKNAVLVRIFETLPDRIESPLRLTVASALPKGDRQKFLVEKLAELGVDRFVPLRLERSVARADGGATARLRRYVIEAAKQCGRNVLMEITDEMSLDAFAATVADLVKYILHPSALGAVDPVTPGRMLSGRLPDRIAVVIGPEGSFVDGEVAMAIEHGFRPLDLGARILRTETACVAVASLLLTYAG